MLFFNTPKTFIQRSEPILTFPKTGREFELETLVGKPVICLSNEVENITVGMGKEIIYITKAKQPLLLVTDLVRKKEIVPMGILFLFTKQKFDALNAIDANARISLFFNRLEDYEVTKNPMEEMLTPAEWAFKVYQALEI